MNMSIASAPMAVSTATTTSQTGASNGAAGGNGFAGALVQAINGTTNAQSQGGTPVPLGLAGLLGQLGLSQSNAETNDLMQLLSDLVERLGQLEEGESLTDEQMSSLAALLAAFQGVMQELSYAQSTNVSTSDDGSATLIPLLTTAESQSNPSAVVSGLRQTLQQIATMLENDAGFAAGTSALNGEIKTLLQALGNQLPAANNANATQASAEQTDDATAVEQRGEAPKSNDAANANVSKEAMNQSQTVAVETKRSAPALRDPVWRFQVVDNANVSAESQSANVAPVLAGEEASETGSQQAWTLLTGDAKSTEALQAKPVLPAQVPVQQFAEQLDKFLVKQFLLTQGNGITEAKLTLTPEHLGQVDIRIVMQNGQLTAQFMAENGMARDMLENQMAQLRASLQAQGLQVDRLEVVQQSSSSASASFMQQDHRQHASGGNGNNADGNGGGTYDEKLGFEDELERTTTLREIGYGSSLNVTA
ncbi:flagellar hook-length control protein FliK [Cohnella sp. GCM10027633]|uniref:flagellar hook-length control protein FliK n=1 Tax=unclassified Cohnella TaxID=2636738 RepID=UPI0036354284